MSNVYAEVIYNPTRTRACLITPEGEYICSRMEIGADAITLTPVGKTRETAKAQRWLDMGIVP